MSEEPEVTSKPLTPRDFLRGIVRAIVALLLAWLAAIIWTAYG